MDKDVKKIQDEELKNVSGGAVATDLAVKDMIVFCPNCKSENVTSTSTGTGCDKKTTYTCNDCGHSWE